MRIRRLIGIIALGISTLCAAGVAKAEPYLAVREGLKCSFCHVNKTGGGKRTPAFAMVAENFLRPSRGLFRDIEKRTEHFRGTMVEGVSLGSDVRTSNITSFQDEPDARGRVPNNQVFRELQANDFSVTEANAYLQVDLIKDGLTLYADESFAPGAAANREVVGLLSGFLPWEGYVKAGKFFAPFGLRLHDDAAFTRARTGFNFATPDEGVEVGMAPAGASLAAAVTNGDTVKGNDKGKQLTLNASYQFTKVPLMRSALVGGSFARNVPTGQFLYGVYGGLSAWRLTFLGEADVIRQDEGVEGVVFGRAVHAEVDWAAVDWLNVKLAYDWFDPDRDVREDQQDRVTVGVEPFLAKYLQLRLLYVTANGIPQRPQDNASTLTAELHLFF